MASRNYRQAIAGIMAPFDYSTPPTVVPAIVGGQAGTATADITVDRDARFLVTGIAGTYTIQANGLAAIPYLNAEPRVQIIASNAGIQLWNDFTSWGNIIGTGEEPMQLPIAYVVPAGTLLKVKFENRETVAYVCTVTLQGLKVYR